MNVTLEPQPVINLSTQDHLDSAANSAGKTSVDVFDGPMTLTLARSESALRGHVVVTFAKTGNLSCTDLLKCANTQELLSRAEASGVQIDEAALLAMTDEDGQSRTVYVTPKPDTNFRDFSVWVGQVTETLRNLKAKKVGFYLCRDSLTSQELAELMAQVIRSVAEAKFASNVALVVGHHAYNELLQMALELKSELDAGNLGIHVLH